MEEMFLTFRKFNDAGLASEIASQLKQYDIECVLEDNRKIFDPSFAYNTVEPEINLKLRSADFSKADKALENFYQKDLDNIDPGYYLFEFTDDELVEIISKPDEWGHFDYQLAKKILRERGKEIKPEEADLLKTNRIEELSQPDNIHTFWIYFGYITSVLGAPFGILIGCILAYFKKTLPNGQRIYAYREKDRNHGTRMIIISCISLLFWMGVRWKDFMDNG